MYKFTREVRKKYADEIPQNGYDDVGRSMCFLFVEVLVEMHDIHRIF